MRLIIHHHLGLGDHFVCNGLVRFIIDKNNYEQYYIPAKENERESKEIGRGETQLIRENTFLNYGNVEPLVPMNPLVV